jgi:tetratricopeptide (TPR) repeat protein
MRRLAAILAVLVLAGLGGLGPIGADFNARADEEMDRYLENLRSQTESLSLPLEKRAQAALDLAATLDRLAQSAAGPDERRARWTEAIDALDAFQKRNPTNPRTPQIRFQAAVYLWARGRLWVQQAELEPANAQARTAAVESLDAACDRLRDLLETQLDPVDLVTQNARFRLAQALHDRARLEAEGADSRRTRQDEALRLLEKPISEPALRGFARLLRGELLAAAGRGREAQVELDAAAKANPAPPEAEVLEARVAALIGERNFDAALAAIRAAHVGAPLKGLLTVRVYLARRRTEEAGRARSETESALFKVVETLRKSPDPDARLALLALARGVAEPDAKQGPDAWDTLAEGAAALGDLGRASVLESKGADRAEALGEIDRAWTLRLRAGATRFRQGKFLEADQVLTRVVEAPRAGSSRPKAALLRALARGRALALHLPGASQAAYVAALESLLHDFPNDHATSEARWLLGKLKLATGERDEAEKLWTEIPRNSSRWLEARLALSDVRQEALDTQRINNDRDLVRKRYDEARNLLDETLAACRTATERADVNLALARLELTPQAGHPDQAQSLCQAVQRLAGRPDQRDQARRLHMIAVAEHNHFLEAEQEARAEVSRARPAALLETVRLLDYVAADAQSDLRMRRLGLILRILLGRVLDRPENLAPDVLAEARLRMTRALIFSGDLERARSSLLAWSNSPPPLDDRTLRDIADAYTRLEAYPLAADVQRLRSQRSPAGTLPWFESRYGLALAYYRSGKEKEAAKLIDGTAILHPDLGGGELRTKFIRLRERLNPGQ